MALTIEKLQEMTARFPSLRFGLIGDACVDIYWEADMTRSRLSREVPNFPLPVTKERFSLGGGANVAANLMAAELGGLEFLTISGTDWRGMILRTLLEQIHIPADGVLTSEKLFTPAYCKPIRHGISEVSYEDPRIDFGNTQPISRDMEERLIERLRQTASRADLLMVCDQLEYGCMTPAVIEEINRLGRQLPIIVDSRDRISQYKNVIIKPNEVEAAACLGRKAILTTDQKELQEAGRTLFLRTGRPVIITLGADGAFWYDETQCVKVPAYPVQQPIDFVGAGDSFMAGFCLAYACGASAEDALLLGCLAAGVTIRKIGETGTASPQELVSLLQSVNKQKQ